MDGGTDNDYIYTNYSYNSIFGGTGNDTIYAYGSYNTIEGGEGNDYIHETRWYYYNRFIYSEGAGNDTISGLD